MINIIDWSAWLIIGNGNMVETKDNPDAYAVLKSSRKNTLLFMHNHPSTTTFSGTDFKTFCSNDSLYMITVVGNDGSVRALMKIVLMQMKHWRIIIHWQLLNIRTTPTMELSQ